MAEDNCEIPKVVLPLIKIPICSSNNIEFFVNNAGIGQRSLAWEYRNLGFNLAVVQTTCEIMKSHLPLLKWTKKNKIILAQYLLNYVPWNCSWVI